MAWNAGKYFTQSRRINGKVIRIYRGLDPEGYLLAEWLDDRRKMREIDTRRLRVACLQLEAIEDLLTDVAKLADLLTRAALVAAGYRQHKRGEWRKQRGRSRRRAAGSFEAETPGTH